MSYIYGERESGPNGAKRDFLRKSAAFLHHLGKNLEFTQVRVNTNPAGIGLSGEVTLYGIWSSGSGVFFEITQSGCRGDLLYREIKALKDFKGGPNKWLDISIFEDMDYRRLCDTLLELKRGRAEKNAA